MGPEATSALGEAERRAQAEARAREALAAPLSPELEPRCTRCGERLDDDPSGSCPRCGAAPGSALAGERLVAQSRSPLAELARGVAYLPRGLFQLARTPALWPYAIVPLLLNVLFMGLVFYAVLSTLPPWLARVGTEWSAAGGVWSALAKAVGVLETLAGTLLPVVASLAVAWLLVVPPLAIVYKALFMPVMELATEATDRLVLGIRDSGRFELRRFLFNLALALLDAFLLTLLQALVLTLLLPCHLVPGIGTVIWALVPPAVFAGMDYSDINLVRRRYTTREKVRLWRHHGWRFFGYGVSFCFLLTIPLLNALVVPAAAVGGALLYLELDRK